MLDVLFSLFDTRGFAPHGYCLLWQPGLVWTHVMADGITALAYFTIPVALVYLVRKRGDVAFSGLFFCFAAFILACGATHIFSIITLWVPLYGLQGVVKAFTAVVSVATAGALWPLMPKLLAIPSPAQLRRANEALAQRITERDEAIRRLEDEIVERERAEAMLAEQSEELVMAHAAVQAASQAKSNFLANMSHELRTPLNAVMGYAQLLTRDKVLEPRHIHAAQTIHESGAHLLTLINDILDLSKIEAGKFELFPASIDLRGFIRGIAAIIRVRTEEKALDFVCDLPEDLPEYVLADEKRLRQVLLNLLGNAVKFTDRGTITLSVSALTRSDGGVCLNFAVRDTGVGIAADQLPAIFRPFEQVGATDRRAGGTGLGLSISRQLIDLMDSTLKVESTLGEGSLFWFDLDLPLSHDQSNSGRGGVECVGYKGPRRRVLVVDDITANREVLAAMLDELGFVVEQANTAQESIDQARASAPELIMMDIRMPGMDGLEAIRVLKADGALAHVPIIAVSSGITPDNQARAIEAGAQSFLPKPLDRVEMIALVGRALDLEWVEESRKGAAPAQDALVAPPPDVLAPLHEAAMAGNMRMLRQLAEGLGAQDERWTGFGQTVVRMARAFQSQAVLALIETHMETRP